MSRPIIEVENLSKRYRLGQFNAQTMREEVEQLFTRFRKKRTGDNCCRTSSEFWALKNVSFSVQPGEIVGIIGRNGAGKSTLLKILSGVTKPTTGEARIRGRLASLLEVGTGFHPELTGRENIYLNGAILGMARAEIRRKFDDMVVFADVEEFLDTPVKRYSSGMYVRLAFAVAAHLEPEILIIDEVLAVGDYEFQQKCVSKMQDVVENRGRTVLLVSHNLSIIKRLANRALLMDRGRLVAYRTVPEAISAYLSTGPLNEIYVAPETNASSAPHVSRVEVVTSEKNGIHQFGKPLELRITISHEQPAFKLCLTVQILNQEKNPVLLTYAYHPDKRFGEKPGRSELKCQLPNPRLNVGRHYLRVFLSEPPGGVQYDRLDCVCPFEVVHTNDDVLWGWRPEHCAYHDDWSWAITEEPVPYPQQTNLCFASSTPSAVPRR
jgi:lipopolysaccharide transport system ATP-binding protein